MAHQSDPGRIKTESPDTQRDLAAKGGPAVGLGDAQNRKAPDSETDLNTKAAINPNATEEEDETSSEGQTKSRAGNRVPGSNH